MEDSEDMNDDIDLDNEDPSILAAKKKQKIDEIIQNFGRYREMKEEIIDYKEEEKKMQIVEIDNKEEMDRLDKELTIEFDKAKVSTVIKRGREELNKKEEEFKEKNEILKKEIKDLEVVEWEIQKKDREH